ncbi:MAG TPA: hypothetical protein VKA13_01240, partial [Gammaproteobacteria bacterium]|nr:hypothetical protein [Gammaproteobacteria bacterium]
ILNGPKPTYYPTYIRQATGADGRRLQGEAYTTYMDADAEIRGWKRYPARPDDQAHVQRLGPDQQRNGKVQTRLHPLPAGAQFRGALRFHNLRPFELGAVLWAMTWGGREGLRHGLGMGRPFGFGQVRIVLEPDEHQDMRANCADAPPPTAAECMARFEQHMDAAFRQACAARAGWADSEQITQLLAMADPDRAPGQQRDLVSMTLQDPRNDFVDAKKAYAVLPEYVPFDGSPDAALFSRDAAQGGGSPDGACPWVDWTLAELAADSNADAATMLRGRALARRWDELEDAELKQQALEDIRRRWDKFGWWEQPPGKAARAALAIYQKAGAGSGPESS